MMKDFKEFIMRGNVMDLAVGVIIGAAFGKIVTSLTTDIIMPLVSLVTGKIDFSNMFVTLSGTHTKTLTDAKAANAVTLNYGLFLTGIIDFVIVAFVVFMLVRFTNRFKKPVVVSTRDCPRCCQPIANAATRCPHCTSDVPAA